MIAVVSALTSVNIALIIWQTLKGVINRLKLIVVKREFIKEQAEELKECKRQK